VIAVIVVIVIAVGKKPLDKKDAEQLKNDTGQSQPYPLSIQYMRSQQYPGSDIVIEQTLPDGVNYRYYIASYKSEGLKIYGLLTIPKGDKPTTGWPVIIFNHGYIPPEQYRTTERYVAYIDSFARDGYIVFKPRLPRKR